MFSETEIYTNNGHFFFKKGDNLSICSKGVPNAPGVYYILKLARGKVELVYIGRSGTMLCDGSFKDQLLRRRINNTYKGVRRQAYLERKIEEENIDALDIYWFVTMDQDNQDLPGFVEGLLIQRYYDVYGVLPPWNKCY